MQVNLRRMFSFMPERARRFFNLTLQLKPDLPLSDLIIEEHSLKLKSAEEDGRIILAVREQSGYCYSYVFQSPNEIEPFDFMQESPFKQHSLLMNYRIEELEMRLRTQDKELAPKYLRE